MAEFFERAPIRTAVDLTLPPYPYDLVQPGIKALLGPRHVRADLLLADLDVLEPVMERAYGGWDSAAARGWNWGHWFGDWRKQLAARGAAELSYNEAFAPMDALLAFQRDNRAPIPLKRRASDGSQTAILASARGSKGVEIRAGGRPFSIAANDARGTRAHREAMDERRRGLHGCALVYADWCPARPRRCAAARTGSHCNPSGTDRGI